MDTNGNRWKFNDGTPGKLDIYARAIATPSSEYVDAELVDRVEFVFAPHAPITGSTLSWSHPSELDAGYATHRSWPDSDAGCWEAKATLTGLPDHNADFGTKQLRLMLRRVDNGNRYHVGNPHDLQVYYTGTAMNHPDPGNGTVPNWFYYYRDQERVNGIGQDYEYVNDADSHTLANYWIKIGNAAYSGNFYNKLGLVSGVLRFQEAVSGAKYWPQFCGTVRHEQWHYGHPELPHSQDFDGDRISDAEEYELKSDPFNNMSIFGGSHVAPGDIDSTKWDQEMIAGGPIEQAGIDGATRTVDWAYPGSQWAEGE